MGKRTKMLGVVLLTTVALIFPLLKINGNASAIDSTEVFTKVLVNNVENCYKNALKSNVTFSSYLNFDSLMNAGYTNSNYTEHGFYIPAITDDFNKMTTSDSINPNALGARFTSCYALFMGDDTGLNTLPGNMKGLFEIYNKKSMVPTSTNKSSTLTTFMKDLMQYSVNVENASTTEICYAVYMQGRGTADQKIKIGEACRNKDSYPIALSAPVFTGNESDKYRLSPSVSINESTGKFEMNLTVEEITKSNTCVQWESLAKCAASVTLDVSSAPTGLPLTNNLTDSAAGVTWGNQPNIFVEITEKASTGENSSSASYTKGNNWNAFILALTGQSYDSFAFTDVEKYDFYLQYLKQNYGMAGGASISSTQCVETKPNPLVNESEMKYYIWTKGSGWCLANLDSSKVNKEVVMTIFPNGNNRTVNRVIRTLKELIEAMGALNYSDESAFTEIDQAGQTSSTNGVLSSATTENEDPCYNMGVEGMSWVLCPALNNMKHTATAMDAIIKDWMEVDASLYSRYDSNGDETSVYLTWKGMQNIANTLLILIFLAIVFSQLTGYGIDNYGIKKMLPRLVLMAILINLSFYICQIVIDLANIFGEGLNDLFGGWGDALLQARSFGDNVESFIGGAITTIFAATGLAGAGAGTAITIATAVMSGNGVMAVIIVVLALVVIIAAILLFFIGLGARMIIVILCVATAPLALASFILPNTQVMFKRWLNVFKMAILMYPLCGALGGISTLIKGIVTTMDGVHLWMMVVAMISPFLPFFLLPSLLKGTIATLGKVGGALAAMGTAWRGGLMAGERAVQNTDSYKSTMQEGRMNMLRHSVGMGKNGMLTARGEKKLQRAQRKGGAQLKMYASQLATVDKDDATKKESNRILYNTAAKTGISKNTAGYTDAHGTEQSLTAAGGWGSAFTDNGGKTREAYYARQFLTAAESGKVDEMDAAIEAAKAAGMKDKHIAQMVRNAANNGNIKLGDDEMRTWSQNLATKHGNGFLASDYELSHWAATGGDGASRGRTGVFGSGYGDYAKNALASGSLKMDDIKKEDLLRLSGDSIAGMVSAGLITKAMAQQVLSENPNLSEDKKIMFGATAAGYAQAGINAASFKADVENIMQHGYTGTIGGRTVAQDRVEQWVAPPQQRVFISQNDQSGFYQQDKPVRVVLDGPGTNIPHGTPPTPTVGPGPTPPPTPPPTPTVGPGPTPPPTPPPATGGSI